MSIEKSLNTLATLGASWLGFMVMIRITFDSLLVTTKILGFPFVDFGGGVMKSKSKVTRVHFICGGSSDLRSLAGF